MNEITDAHRAEFAKYVAKWQRELNLMDWRFVPGTKPAQGAMADMSIQIGARLAVWRLGKSFGSEEVTEQALEAAAFHESFHVLLADLTTAIETKAAPEVIEAAEHRIINTVERLLVPLTPQSATTNP